MLWISVSGMGKEMFSSCKSNRLTFQHHWMSSDVLIHLTLDVGCEMIFISLNWMLGVISLCVCCCTIFVNFVFFHFVDISHLVCVLQLNALKWFWHACVFVCVAPCDLANVWPKKKEFQSYKISVILACICRVTLTHACRIRNTHNNRTHTLARPCAHVHTVTLLAGYRHLIRIIVPENSRFRELKHRFPTLAQSKYTCSANGANSELYSFTDILLFSFYIFFVAVFVFDSVCSHSLTLCMPSVFVYA